MFVLFHGLEFLVHVRCSSLVFLSRFSLFTILRIFYSGYLGCKCQLSSQANCYARRTGKRKKSLKFGFPSPGMKKCSTKDHNSRCSYFQFATEFRAECSFAIRGGKSIVLLVWVEQSLSTVNLTVIDSFCDKSKWNCLNYQNEGLFSFLHGYSDYRRRR